MASYIENPHPEHELEALYNIYRISFNNIKGSASGIERGRSLARLKALEKRADDLRKDFEIYQIERLSVYRQARPEHSQMRWRLKAEDGRWKIVTLESEEGQSFLESLGEEMRKIVLGFDSEFDVINVNLKLEWIEYLFRCKRANVDAEPPTKIQFV